MLIPEDYKFVMATGLLTCMHYMMQGIPIGNMRKKIFNKEFMEKEFGEIHST